MINNVGTDEFPHRARIQEGPCVGNGPMWYFGRQEVKIAMYYEIKRNSKTHIANEIDHVVIIGTHL